MPQSQTLDKSFNSHTVFSDKSHGYWLQGQVQQQSELTDYVKFASNTVDLVYTLALCIDQTHTIILQQHLGYTNIINY